MLKQVSTSQSWPWDLATLGGAVTILIYAVLAVLWRLPEANLWKRKNTADRDQASSPAYSRGGAVESLMTRLESIWVRPVSFSPRIS